jgi:ankyrin repeat protein
LHVACRFSHTRLTQLLLAEGYSPNCRGSNGSTPLLLAAMGGAAELSAAAVAAMAAEQPWQQQQQQCGGLSVMHPVTLAGAIRMRPCIALGMAAAAGSSSSSTASLAAAGQAVDASAIEVTVPAILVADLAGSAAAAPPSAAPVACVGCGRHHQPKQQQQQQQCAAVSSSSSRSIHSSRSLLCMILMAAGADDQAMDLSGVTVAMAAAGCGLTWLVETALHESTDALRAAAASVLEKGPLNWAAPGPVDPAVVAAAAAAPVRALVAAAADGTGWTALHWAAANGQEGGCEDFLKLGVGLGGGWVKQRAGGVAGGRGTYRGWWLASPTAQREGPFNHPLIWKQHGAAGVCTGVHGAGWMALLCLLLRGTKVGLATKMIPDRCCCVSQCLLKQRQPSRVVWDPYPWPQLQCTSVA